MVIHSMPVKASRQPAGREDRSWSGYTSYAETASLGVIAREIVPVTEPAPDVMRSTTLFFTNIRSTVLQHMGMPLCKQPASLLPPEEATMSMELPFALQSLVSHPCSPLRTSNSVMEQDRWWLELSWIPTQA